MKSKTDNIIDDYFSVWDSQTEYINNHTPDNISPTQIQRPSRIHYTELLFQESILLFFSIALFIAYAAKWNCVFEIKDSPTLGYIVSLIVWLIGIADSLIMILRICKINIQKNTAFEIAKKSATLALVEKIELFLALLVIIPLSLFSVVPTTIWLLSNINLYSEWNVYKHLYLLPILVAILIDIVLCILIYLKNTKYIKIKISEWKYYKQLK